MILSQNAPEPSESEILLPALRERKDTVRRVAIGFDHDCRAERDSEKLSAAIVGTQWKMSAPSPKNAPIIRITPPLLPAKSQAALL